MTGNRTAKSIHSSRLTVGHGANHPALNNAKRVPRLVGVIASPAALASATRLRLPPDLFELRLDALRSSLGKITRALPRLRAPLILTARHPAEGGAGQLTAAARQALLEPFLEQAAFIDLELRVVRQMEFLLGQIRERQIELILSFHDLGDTPSLNRLDRLRDKAAAAGAQIFKLATRTDTPVQVKRLIAFFEEANRGLLPIAAMGIGRLGRESRRQLDRLGSALSYGSLGPAKVEGQPSLSQLRRDRAAYTIWKATRVDA
jgi:3-dehydroquinate dehydratase-1